jgi:hypothetical protein
MRSGFLAASCSKLLDSIAFMILDKPKIIATAAAGL